MGVTHREFYRLIYRLLPEDEGEKTDGGIKWKMRTKTIDIKLKPEGIRNLGPTIAFPFTNLSIKISGFSEDEQQKFISDFDQCFRKGGG